VRAGEGKGLPGLTPPLPRPGAMELLDRRPPAEAAMGGSPRLRRASR